MRCCLLALVLLFAGGPLARADSLADLRRPSSTIPGCVNTWGPFGAGEPTCEGKAALAEWNEHAAAINLARDTLVNASNLPDRANPQAVVTALDAAAAAADAMVRLYHPAQPRPGDIADVLAWMRPWFEQQHLPVPASIGDGFRTLAHALQQPGLLRQERNTLLGQAAVFATRESALAAELGSDVQQQTDAAVNAAHLAALRAARAAEDGHPLPDAGAAIAAAAGPGHPAIAQEQTRQLDASLAAHPGQGSYAARTGRKLWAIPDAFLWIAGFTLAGLLLAFRRLAAAMGPSKALGASLAALVALPLSWLPLGGTP